MCGRRELQQGESPLGLPGLFNGGVTPIKATQKSPTNPPPESMSGGGWDPTKKLPPTNGVGMFFELGLMPQALFFFLIKCVLMIKSVFKIKTAFF